MEKSGGTLARLRSQELLDELASSEHERWSHWQRYLHSQCDAGEGGTLVIPADLVRRWKQQSNTQFADLSEDEKESDREQVRSYLPIIEQALTA